MKIVVKPTTKCLEEYINAGANAFIFAIEKLSSNKSINFSINEIKKIKNNYPDITIYALVDKNIFNKEIETLEKTLLEIDKINIDGIIFYDLAVYEIVKEKNINTPLILNKNYLVNNYKTCNYYYDKGITSIILPSEITKEEILEIRKNTKAELFINIFGYQVMAFSERKLITNYFKYIDEKNTKKNNYILKEGNKYHIIENKEATIIMSPYILNGIKYLDQFKNIDYIILDEIDLPHTKFIKVIKIFNEVINNKISVVTGSDKINKLFTTSLGFFDTKTIYKVKK